MSDRPYENRELDEKFKNVTDSQKRMHEENQGVLQEILTQTKKTNGRVNRLERNLLIVSCVVATVLVLKGSELVEVAKTLFL